MTKVWNDVQWLEWEIRDSVSPQAQKENNTVPFGCKEQAHCVPDTEAGALYSLSLMPTIS